MTTRDVADIYPLTPTQEGLLFHTLLAPDSGVYVIQQHGVLEGELDLAALSAAWDRVVERQAVLRTSFEWDGLDPDCTQDERSLVSAPIPDPASSYDGNIHCIRDLRRQHHGRCPIEALHTAGFGPFGNNRVHTGGGSLDGVGHVGNHVEDLDAPLLEVWHQGFG